MHPTLQLIERHQSILSEFTTHWFDLPESSPLVKQDDQIFNLLWTRHNSARLDTDSWPLAELNILFYPKAKDRLDWWLTQLTQESVSGKLWVVGENNGGIKSLPKRVKGYFNCTKLDSARHCALYELDAIEAKAMKALEWRTFTYNALHCFALPGVFSSGRLDKGSEILLSVLPPVKGKVLEFGGGCGVLTAHLASNENVSHVTALEIDLLSVRSSNKTLQENSLSHKATTLWSDGTNQLEQQSFATIVTNPPFHQGIKTEYGPTEEFFKTAHQWLKPAGELIWVANDFLNYQQFLEPHFHSAVELAHERGFKVWRATRKRG